jgi:hypothetical protein
MCRFDCTSVKYKYLQPLLLYCPCLCWRYFCKSVCSFELKEICVWFYCLSPFPCFEYCFGWLYCIPLLFNIVYSIAYCKLELVQTARCQKYSLFLITLLIYLWFVFGLLLALLTGDSVFLITLEVGFWT